MIVVGGVYWQYEVSWFIYNDDNDEIYSGGVPVDIDKCLNHATTYIIYRFDSYSDGWNDNTAMIRQDIIEFILR